MTEAVETIVVADIGGTHARFALARLSRGRRPEVGEATVLRTKDFPSLAAAYAAFAASLPQAPPRRGCFALACPIRGEELKFTNNPWRLRPAALARECGLDELRLLNDFGAVAHAVARAHPDDLQHICGPRRLPPETGVTSIVGPGTGLGVAQLIRAGEAYRVVETEGAHASFAPRDLFEDGLLLHLRAKFGRVSIERVLSGPGLAEIRAALPGAAPEAADDKTLWTRAISGEDSLGRQALQKFGACLGAVAGDIALMQGAHALVLAGGLVPRFAPLLPETGFAEAFVAKGRYREMLENIPVWLIVHPQPGLFGAAAAFPQ